MAKLIPQQFLFRFKLRSKRVRWPLGDAPLPPAAGLPQFGGLDGRSGFADVRTGWAPEGFVLEWKVPGKKQPLYGEPLRPEAGDGLTFWLDTRDTRGIHRATRRCLAFRVLANGGADGAPKIEQLSINRALEDAPRIDVALVALQRKALAPSGSPTPEKADTPTRAYWLRAIFPAAALPGYEPGETAKLGFCYQLRDREYGEQLLAAGPEFPFAEDPSLWATLELSDE